MVIKVETPTNLTDEQRDLLRKFAELRGDEMKETQGKTFFERVKDAINGL